MIPTTELRRGNLVYEVDGEGVPFFVYRIWHNGVELASDMEGSDDIDCYDVDLVPILLTEEWFIKFNFTKYSYGFQNKIFIRNSHKNCYEIRISDGLGYLEIKYVHQLQNLYFALTREELTLKQC